jgi:hypothetical protein
MGNEPDPAADALVRQLYWEQRGTPPSALGAADVRERLIEFVAKMRTDENLVIPFGEPTLLSRRGSRRKLKYVIFRLARPVSWRYDRLVGDLAELSVGLAERLVAAETEIARLRERVDAEDSGSP